MHYSYLLFLFVRKQKEALTLHYLKNDAIRSSISCLTKKGAEKLLTGVLIGIQPFMGEECAWCVRKM